MGHNTQTRTDACMSACVCVVGGGVDSDATHGVATFSALTVAVTCYFHCDDAREHVFCLPIAKQCIVIKITKTRPRAAPCPDGSRVTNNRIN